MADPRDVRRPHLTIALASGAVILFEIGVTRLLSVVLWYHYAFLAVSLAMLGLGAPGVWFALRRPSPALLPRLLLAAACAIPLTVIVTARSAEWLEDHVARVVLVVAALLVPFLLLGAAVCLLLVHAGGRRIGSVYAWDLLGAAIGAAAVVPLMHAVATPVLLAGIALLPFLGAWLERPRNFWIPALAALLLATLVWPEPYRVRHGKMYGEETLEILHERWTPTARLTVFSSLFFEEDPGLAYGWGMGSRFEPVPLEQLWLEQDGSAGTPITRLEGDPARLEHLFYDVTSVGYQLRPPRRVCVIGSGGGRDILTALKAGAVEIDAVEFNAALIEIVDEQFGDFSGGVYRLPGVRAVASEGRSFLTRADTRYDLIQISLIDSWAATTAGAYALSENFLYTLEALRLYWSRTSDRGLISISRWMVGDQQIEAARLALLAQAALQAEGVAHPLAHLALVQGGRIGTLLISREPFRASELARLDGIGAERGFTRHWPPQAPGDLSVVGSLLREGPDRLVERGLFLAPPTDERPFFFQNVRAFTAVDPSLYQSLSFNDQAAVLPRVLLALLLGIAFVAFLAPFVWTRRLGADEGDFWRGSFYFLAVGMAFMWVEIPLIQRSILFLGHPSYATTVVLATLLLGSAAGSWSAARTPLDGLRRRLFVVPGAALLASLLLPLVFSAALGNALAVRVAISILAIAPIGFCMGLPFPAGMIAFAERNRAWYWALNGGASVVASASTVALAAYTGFGGVVLLGAAAYLLAALFLSRA